jgi:DNA-binding transcriptional LysR family regulator
MSSVLRRIECDLLVAPSSLVPRELLSYQNRYLFTDEFLVVVDKDNESVGDRITIEELSRQRYLEYNVRVLRTMSEKHRVRATLSTDGGYFAVAMQLVAGTRMVTLAQARLVSLFGASAGLRAVALDVDLPLISESMYWHPKHTADPAHIWLRNRLAEVAATV